MPKTILHTRCIRLYACFVPCLHRGTQRSFLPHCGSTGLSQEKSTRDAKTVKAYLQYMCHISQRSDRQFRATHVVDPLSVLAVVIQAHRHQRQTHRSGCARNSSPSSPYTGGLWKGTRTFGDGQLAQGVAGDALAAGDVPIPVPRVRSDVMHSSHVLPHVTNQVQHADLVAICHVQDEVFSH